jgi:hypothetical protein
MTQLGRVDPDIAHLLDALAEPDVDGVAVHDPDDQPLEWSRLPGGEAHPGQQGGERQEGAEHPSTVSRQPPPCL